jgi:hypothetical protein
MTPLRVDLSRVGDAAEKRGGDAPDSMHVATATVGGGKAGRTRRAYVVAHVHDGKVKMVRTLFTKGRAFLGDAAGALRAARKDA